MKKLTIKKLELIFNDFKENEIDFIDNDQMAKLYELYGDDVFYNGDIHDMEVTKKGGEYIKLKER